MMEETLDDLKSGPNDGCYIRGLYLEGARWDAVLTQLGESRPKELFTEVPIIWLKPTANRAIPETGTFDCPVYKTLTRAGKSHMLQCECFTIGGFLSCKALMAYYVWIGRETLVDGS